jgi:hypothetical protein
MANDDSKSAPPPVEVKVATVEPSDAAQVSPPAPTPSNGVAIEKTSLPALVDAEMLVLGLRYLQQLIPGFVQLSIAKERSMARAAYLDPEFMEAGMHVAGIWDRAEAIIGRDPGELRRDAEESRRWDDAIRELRAFTNGIADANLARKHRLGKNILDIYFMLGNLIRRAGPESVLLRPYYDEMKRLYLRRLRKAKARNPAKEEEPGSAKE